MRNYFFREIYTHKIKLFSSTLGHFVQNHRNLLVVKETPLQELDKHPVGEASGADLKSLCVLAPEQV